MGLSISWSVESKDFEMLVKDGDTGLLIQERSRGLLRSVRLGSSLAITNFCGVGCSEGFKGVLRPV
jgi:hypothetical protein